MTKFSVRDSLMTTICDDLTAYGIANKFVMDDQDKLKVFERCYSRTNGQTVEVRASQAKDQAQILWEKVYSAS